MTSVLESLPDRIISRRCILFLGAGFSASARNLEAQPLPLAAKLKAALESELGIGPSSYELGELAEAYEAERSSRALYELFYRAFTSQRPADHHRQLLSSHWRTVYTTNYDDLAENSYLSNSITARSYCYRDRLPQTLQAPPIVHLHGYIRSRYCDPDNILNYLILTTSSYIKLEQHHSDWLYRLEHDILSCDYCFFVGCSLRDHNIETLLYRARALTSKIFFITSENMDPIAHRKFRLYGSVLPIGVEAFAELMQQRTSDDDIFSGYSVRYFYPIRIEPAASSPTPLTAPEILDLLAFGTFEPGRLVEAYALQSHRLSVIPRRDKIDRALDALDKSGMLIVHSYLGNGKSIFMRMLATELSMRHHVCYLAMDVKPDYAIQEIDFLCKDANLALFFDSYDTYVTWAPLLRERAPAAKIVIAVRTPTLELRWHEFKKFVPNNVTKMNLDYLTPSDLGHFEEILSLSGLLPSSFSYAARKTNRLGELVVSLFDNQQVLDEIRSIVNELRSTRELRRASICLMLFSVMDATPDTRFVEQIVGADPFLTLSRAGREARELFEFDTNGPPRARSALLGRFVLGKFFETQDVLDVLKDVVMTSVTKKRERRYRLIFGAATQMSTLRNVIGERTPSALELARGFYETLRHNKEVNEEPLFWLQYAICMFDAKDIGISERFCETAYSRASNIPGFLTYQIDTFALNLLLTIEAEEAVGTPVDRYDRILELLYEANSMIVDDSHRVFVVRALRAVLPFVKRRIDDLGSGQKAGLAMVLRAIERAMRQLPVAFKRESRSERVRRDLDKAIGMLAKDA